MDCALYDCINNTCTSSTICQQPKFDVRAIVMTIFIIMLVKIYPREDTIYMVSLFILLYLMVTYYNRYYKCGISIKQPTYLSSISDYFIDNESINFHPDIKRQIYTIDILIYGFICVYICVTLLYFNQTYSFKYKR